MEAQDFIASARKEVLEERFKELKETYKRKLRQVADAKRILANLEREMVDIELQIAEEV